ncbi:MAG TPA: hypothetical protein DCZ72_15840 [Armatimonadetes bacterium]|nr:hypothetical protein [Armatimonadota bacterium]
MRYALATVLLLLALAATAQTPDLLGVDTLNTPVAISATPTGTVLVIDQRGDEAAVVELSADGTILADLPAPAEMAPLGEQSGALRDSAGNLYLWRGGHNQLATRTAGADSWQLTNLPQAARAVALATVDGVDWLYALADQQENSLRYRLPALTAEPLEWAAWPAEGRFDALRVRADGTAYAFAGAENLVYQISADGALVAYHGSGNSNLSQPAGRLWAAFDVDQASGDLYWSLGDYGALYRLLADGQTVVGWRGREAWNRTWIGPIHNHPAVAVAGQTAFITDRENKRVVAVPLSAVALDAENIDVFDTRRFGLLPKVFVGAPHGLVTEPRAEVRLDLAAGNRRVAQVNVRWEVVDYYRQPVGGGQLDLDLGGREAISLPLGTVDLPAYGWYQAIVSLRDGDELLDAHAGHVAYTPNWPGLPDADDVVESKFWNDLDRTAWCGQGMHRVHIGDLDTVEQCVEDAERLGLVLMVQLENREHAELGRVREAVERFRGRVKYWEVINEPNFGFTPEEYAELLVPVAEVIREVDPDALVLGPTVCGLILDWHERFFATGAGAALDIITTHSYEGNESIDPDHWAWKYGELRRMMADAGLGDRPIWQTERATGGVRARTFLGGVQAARVTLERDVLDSLGVPNEHNWHYYVNEGGYHDVPTYLWSSSGPHPAALALRTRTGVLAGATFAERLDAGTLAQRLWWVTRHVDAADGRQVITLRALGTEDQPAQLTLAGATSATLTDSWGNQSELTAAGGVLTVPTTPLPVYLTLPAAATVQLVAPTWGPNLAPSATLAYSGATENDLATLTNDVIENVHPSTPWGALWSGELTQPETLELTWAQPQSLDHVVVYSSRADNPHCALVEFEVQVPDGAGWRTVGRYAMDLPPSDPAVSANSLVSTWYRDQNIAVVEWPAETTDRLRLRFLRSTMGFVADRVATEIIDWEPGGDRVWLREVEVFGPGG